MTNKSSYNISFLLDNLTMLSQSLILPEDVHGALLSCINFINDNHNLKVPENSLITDLYCVTEYELVD